MEPRRIKVSDIRKVVLRLLDHIERDRGIEDVEISQNFYWLIDPGARFDMGRDPSEFEVGSLIDDWDLVSGLLQEGSEPVSLQLTELAPVLDFVGRAVGR
jgi:hypothetical protein